MLDWRRKSLASRHEYIRAWTVRLLGDDRIVSPSLLRQFVRLARHDSSVVVRGQLACTAKRLPASESMPIVEQLLRHDEDADDVQMPLLIWWAIEDKAISDTDRVLRMVQAGDLWHRPLMTRFIIERLARRFLSEGTQRVVGRLCDSAATCPSGKDRRPGALRNVAGTLRTKAGPRPATVGRGGQGNHSPRIGQSASDRTGAQTELAGRLQSGHSIRKQPRDASGRSAVADQGARRIEDARDDRQSVIVAE